MSVAAIVKALADEFSVDQEHAQRAFELLNDGHKVPTLARFRRAEVGSMTDGVLRRFQRRMKQLEELESRRAVLLASIREQRRSQGGSLSSTETGDKPAEETGSMSEELEKELEPLMNCVDRLELEDLFLPYRRPEPEVQLAFDRGLEPLAELLVARAPKSLDIDAESEDSTQDSDSEGGDRAPEAKDCSPDASSARNESGTSAATDHGVAVESRGAPTAVLEAEESAPAPVAQEDPDETVVEAESSEGAEASDPAELNESQRPEAVAQPESSSAAEETIAAAGQLQPADSEASGNTDEAVPSTSDAKPEGTRRRKGKSKKSAPAPDSTVHGLHIAVSPQLARACAPFVNPDHGIHTEGQALEGAVRILSDRLGRSPSLRGTLRRLMHKHGRLRVRGLVSEKELGRNRSLLKIDQPLRQIQGHRLLSLRQAQAQRQLAPSIWVEEKMILPKVRAALGTRIHPDYRGVADAVAEQGLRQRLQPMIEDEMRNELRERADEEAIRFIAQHLRQILLASPLGPTPVAGVHIDAKGDWLIHVVDRNGAPVGSEIKIEASTADIHTLAKSLGEALQPTGVRALAVGHGKAIRRGVQKLREVIHTMQAGAFVYLVNEGGLSSYANSEQARRELGEHSVPARQAIGFARRLQDPLPEFLKGDVRHLGLGREQSIISKASLRRVLHDTVETCVGFVGCDLNRAPLGLLRYVPGLNFDQAKKLLARREERPFSSLEELRTEGLLDDKSWTNAVGFLFLSESSEPLDRTALHPEQYDLVRRVILESGSSVEEALGRRDALRDLRAENFGVDEMTWRDIQREIGHPGRDPRTRLYQPTLLPPDADPTALEKGQVVEGIVSNVASFGAFVDLGIPRDGMIHISEASNRYVRDARALLSVGQIVRARVVDPSGPRVELSLKNVPDNRRRGPSGGAGGRPPRSGAGGRAGGRGEGRGGEDREKGSAWPEYKPVTRAARSRRDGLVGDRPAGDSRRGGGGGGGGGGGRRPGGGDRGKRRGRDDSYDPAAVREASKPTTTFNPFASFFKEKTQPEGEQEEPKSDSSGGS